MGDKGKKFYFVFVLVLLISWVYFSYRNTSPTSWTIMDYLGIFIMAGGSAYLLNLLIRDKKKHVKNDKNKHETENFSGIITPLIYINTSD